MSKENQEKTRLMIELGMQGIVRPPETVGKEIYLQTGFFALVDPEDYDRVKNIHWFAKMYHSSYYAVAKRKWGGKVRYIKLHRLIAHTPIGMVTHHINHNTLDNRKCNLVNMTPKDHSKLHHDDNIIIQFEKPKHESKNPKGPME